jgi:signal transduction histidine kinase
VSDSPARSASFKTNYRAICTSTPCEQVIDPISPHLERPAISLDTQVRPALVIGDALRLQQVFSNLIQHAITYSPNRGIVGAPIEACGKVAKRQACDQSATKRPTGTQVAPQVEEID